MAADRPAPRTRSAFAIALPLGVAAVMQGSAFWPGILVWDAIRQYGQALTGRYDDWHPPAMNWLWRQATVFGAGPAPMLLLQLLLYWGGTGLLAVAMARRRGHRAGLAVAACALLPIPLWMMGTILKDSLMAGALLAATGLLAWPGGGSGGRVRRGLAAALLLAAATLRFNAAAACLPLLVAALPPAWTRGRARLAAASMLALMPLLLAMPLADRLLKAERSGVELSLVIYDLGGITRFGGADAFPPLPIADPVAVNARCWSPVSWDRYAWWGPDPCPIGFSDVRAAFRARGIDPARWWLDQIARHPIAYAEHRLAHLNRHVRLWTQDAALPGLSVRSDPNPWGYQVPPNRMRDALAALAGASLATPLGWPICWIALGLGLLILAPGRGGADPGTGRDMALPLLASALLYAASYAPLSVASEVRYHVWTMLAVAIAAMLLLTRAAPGSRLSRRRIAVAALPPIAAILIGASARAIL